MQLFPIDHWCHDSSENLASWSHDPSPGIPDGSASGSVIQLTNGRYADVFKIHAYRYVLI